MHDRLCDLRADAADEAVRTHEPRRSDGFQEMLRDERVDGGYAGDIENGDRRASVDDALEETLHDDLRARAVERADQRQREDAFPQPHDRRRQLQHFLLLAEDDSLAGLLMDL